MHIMYIVPKVANAAMEIFQLTNIKVDIMQTDTTIPLKSPRELFKAQTIKLICLVIPVIIVLEFTLI